MYMFFWFFKQLYYCLRRIFKSGILLLFIFFIAFLFLFCNKVKAFSFEENGIVYQLPDPPQTVTDTTPFILGYVQGHTRLAIGYPKSSIDPTKDYFTCYNGAGGASANAFGYFYSGLANGQWDYYFLDDVYDNTWSSKNTTSGYALIYGATGSVIYTSRDIYDGATLFKSANYGSYATHDPFIVTTSSDIQTWSFDYLTINCGSYLTDNTDKWYLYFFPDHGTDQYATIYLNDYIDYQNNTINIPKNILSPIFILRDGQYIAFDLLLQHSYGGSSTQTLYWNLDNYTLDLTSQQVQEINENSERSLNVEIINEQRKTTEAIHEVNNTLNTINQSQQETTNAINNLNNTITDSDVDDSSVYLPQDSSTDITRDGLNGIFTSLYNAFCTGQALDIVFPIPFTNKSITLQANYVRNMLINNGGSWIITLIEAFWWYLISRFIIKDITSKINKIKSGNIEGIETSNIKGDML